MNFNIMSAVLYTVNAADKIGGWYPELKTVYAVIGSVISAMLIYKTAYKIIGLFFTRKLYHLKNSESSKKFAQKKYGYQR